MGVTVPCSQWLVEHAAQQLHAIDCMGRVQLWEVPGRLYVGRRNYKSHTHTPQTYKYTDLCTYILHINIHINPTPSPSPPSLPKTSHGKTHLPLQILAAVIGICSPQLLYSCIEVNHQIGTQCIIVRIQTRGGVGGVFMWVGGVRVLMSRCVSVSEVWCDTRYK